MVLVRKRSSKAAPWLRGLSTGILLACLAASPVQGAVYWNLFNIEGESQAPAGYATYATLSDMLNDTNRLGDFAPNPLVGRNIVGSGSDGSFYWNLFNIEGESQVSALYATYSTLTDMLNDTNRLIEVMPNSMAAGRYVVGSGSDGSLYWNLFNIEGEAQSPAGFATYATLSDMLNDTNRLGDFAPNPLTGGRNIVGSGSDGNLYWNLFNIEEESQISALYATYATLTDMLHDTNRLSEFTPNSMEAGRYIVGTGADIATTAEPVPEPSTWAMMLLGFGAVGFAMRRRAKLMPGAC